MKQYNYLVSFGYQGGGIGSAYIARTSKLDSFEKLEELAKWIHSNSKCENVVIINFQLVDISCVKKGAENENEK